jgi:ribonucleoside-diphosphate reductase alpha chain
MSKIFRTKFSEDIFNHKYRHEGAETWEILADTLVEDVCRDKMSKTEKQHLKKLISEMKFLPGGRYLYYAGRPFKAFNNCYLLKSEEDSRQDWANLSWKAESALMTGGGIGNDYSIYRPKNSIINRTGGLASGPVSKMRMINEIGREVMQGGSRRSAIYASLNWKHGDITEFIHCKDWYNIKVSGIDMSIGDLKEKDFNFPAPLDMTNISVNYDTEWLENYKKSGEIGSVFLDNIKQALKTSEPGFSFNFYEKENETLRNRMYRSNFRR